MPVGLPPGGLLPVGPSVSVVQGGSSVSVVHGGSSVSVSVVQGGSSLVVSVGWVQSGPGVGAALAQAQTELAPSRTAGIEAGGQAVATQAGTIEDRLDCLSGWHWQA